ncbi:hypothetical protein L202_05302 [Cryptococcus amylolentus CBS 6039]|uniref:GATA-type domain-containing protein n=2 Tax=Cryptococcus amylolentus TaxID=104669 RepID=A0A1E3HJY8_9TREE|nr:hypothetical protein L202_05302 [Cryptococcus amylolentus CBS 6039]ODN76658.1 hypothetical protein L202_05302 [Cryptococcus amylolentus CBS 6039]ODO04624.1 hypothetical protein I350_05232 [Cryptococcus amylolentus CBS 6273]
MAFSYYSRPRPQLDSPPPRPAHQPAPAADLHHSALPALPLESEPMSRYPSHSYPQAAQQQPQGYIYPDASPSHQHQPTIPDPQPALARQVLASGQNTWSTSSSPRFQPYARPARKSHSPSSTYLGSPQTGYLPQHTHSQQPSPHIQPLSISSPHPSSALPSPSYMQSSSAPSAFDPPSMPEPMPLSSAGYGVGDSLYDGTSSFPGYVDPSGPAAAAGSESRSWENSTRDVAPDVYAQALALYTHICNSLPYYVPTSQPAPDSSSSTPPTTFDSIIGLASEGHSILSGQAPPSTSAIDIGSFGPSSGFTSGVESPEGRIGGGIASGSAAATTSAVATPVTAPASISSAGRKRRNSGRKEPAGPPPTCLGCGATETPEWRRGPMGPRTLCNACGLVHMKLQRKKRKAEEKAAAVAAA